MSNQVPQKICRGKACCRTIFLVQNIPRLVQIACSYIYVLDASEEKHILASVNCVVRQTSQFVLCEHKRCLSCFYIIAMLIQHIRCNKFFNCFISGVLVCCITFCVAHYCFEWRTSKIGFSFCDCNSIWLYYKL